MIGVLELWAPPLAAALFAAWAALVAVAAEGDPQLPRVLAAELVERRQALSSARTLHVVHLALLLLAAAMGAYAIQWWQGEPAGAVVRLGLVVAFAWIVGDLLPRLLTALAPEVVPVAQRLALPSLVVFRPLLGLVSFADRGTAPVAIRGGEGPDREMLQGVFSLNGMTVAEVMTPRLDIVSVDRSDSRAAVVETFRRARHSRLLVIDDDPDNVVGVLYAKELMGGPGGEDDEVTGWHHLIRPASFVPEAKTLDRQLRDFQRGPAHLTVVVDEFGGTAGLITLEDIVEQIVGEIHDEYDVDEDTPIETTADGAWLVQGGVALSDLEAVLERDLGREDVNTVGGLILAILGRVPRAGEAVEVAGFRFVAEQVARRRVRRVRVEAPAPVPADEEDGA